MTTQKVTLIVDSADIEGNLFTYGQVRISTGVRLPDPGDQLLIEMAPAGVIFDGNGPPQIDLYPSDLIGPQQDNGSPGWTYRIDYENCPGYNKSWAFYILSTGGATQRLSALAVMPAMNLSQQYLPKPTGDVPQAGQVPIFTGNGYETQPGDQTGGGSGSDAFFEQQFSFADTVAVTHSLHKFPAVTVVDSANTKVNGDVFYDDDSNLHVVFGAPFSGTIYCN